MGQRLVLSSFGEANGHLIGAMLDGCPAGLELSEADIQPMLDQRRPGASIIYTQRKEDDAVKIVSGTYRGRTTGAPITMVMDNQDMPSTHYNLLKEYLRPGVTVNVVPRPTLIFSCRGLNPCLRLSGF